jgi:hypothetical protein
MVLPEPSSERGRELLQAVWDLSWDRRGKRARWPTLAALRHAFPRFGAGEAEALLAQMPAGFTNGFGSEDHGNLTDSCELSLTVAAIAACRDTEMILTLFVHFIQYAVTAADRWNPSDIDALLDSALFCNRSRSAYEISVANFANDTSGMPRPSRRRGGLLQQLHLIIASEPVFWVSLSGRHLGDWTVKFDRHIRYFRDIRSLDDYWARRFKPWEGSDPVPYPVVAASKTPDQASRPQLLREFPDLLADVLLERVFDCGGLTSVVSCPKIDPDIDSTFIRHALGRLEARQLVRIPNICASPRLPDVMLTSDGVHHVAALRRGWADRALRDRAARDALLAWLYDRRIHEAAGGFFSDPRSAYSGQFFSSDDMEDSARYLQEKKLIKRTHSNWLSDLSDLRITASGLDCIEQGGSVAEYAKQPAKTNISYSFNAPVSGTNVSIGGKAGQHATVSGLDASSLRTLIQAIVEALPGLGLDTQLLRETRGAADEVVDEIGHHEPDQQGVRAALGKVRDLLGRAGNQALAAVLSAAIDYERSKLGIPPSS